MNEFQTPIKQKRLNDIIRIPASPFLKKLGYGTGIAVYEMERSPEFNTACSPWAIKKLLRKTSLDSEYGKRLRNEAEVLRSLKHPNIVGFRAFVKLNDGKDCLAMEECDSCLGDMIEKRQEEDLGPFPADNIIIVGFDVSKALDYLHNEVKLMHGDIKSYNILIKGNFVVCKICDFGVSIPVDENGFCDKAKAGAEATYNGTSIWAAPEVLQEPEVISTKADIYSFGLMVWEMLALIPPLDNDVDESNDSFYSDESSIIEVTTKKRPPLPNYDFGADYAFILEIYHCCTVDDYRTRMSARDLRTVFEEIIENKKR